MIKDHQDAFGHLIMDYHLGQRPREIIERDDGYVDVSSGPEGYFREYKDWSDASKKALKRARGRILDVGCGAGRMELYFQKKGFSIVGIDNSPLAVKVCKERGAKNVRLMSVTQLSPKLGQFDTVVMCGNNLSLLGSAKRAKWLLSRLHAITSPQGVIIGQTRDPYRTDNKLHLAYHQRNRKLGQMSGQVRIRVRHKNIISPWFDYLFLSKDELHDLISGTGWVVSKFFDHNDFSESGLYWAVLGKEKRRPN